MNQPYFTPHRRWRKYVPNRVWIAWEALRGNAVVYRCRLSCSPYGRDGRDITIIECHFGAPADPILASDGVIQPWGPQ